MALAIECFRQVWRNVSIKQEAHLKRKLTASRVGGELRWEYDDILHEEVAVSRLLEERHALALDRLHETYNKDHLMR